MHGIVFTFSHTSKTIHEVSLNFNIHCAFVTTAEPGRISSSTNVRVCSHS